jgi:hypothetical protein
MSSRHTFWLRLLLLATAQALDRNKLPSRRRALSYSASLFPLLIQPSPGNAAGSQSPRARGAAELDLEYYARDLLRGNRKEGSIQPSQPPTLPSPRVLKEPVLSLLLSDDDSCIPAKALLTELRLSDFSPIHDKVVECRGKAQRSFFARAPWKEATLSDQYYFDLTSYAFWRVAADQIPDYRTRDRFARQMGRRLYDKLQTTGELVAKPYPPVSLSDSMHRVEQVLNVLKSSQFCRSYRLGEETRKSDDSTASIFDRYDDDAIQSGASVNCIVSVFEPATLGASLQITAEQSRFAPDYVSPTLAAIWESMGIQASWETFFVDNEYRPNPKDYFPNEQLIQFTLSKKDASR